ncbi:MAG: potassium channel family protein [Methylococcales bacterium]
MHEGDQQIQLNDFLYFSFVTLTTLDYGDLLPLSATAKTLAFVEAIFSQFYIATLVAGLVAANISSRAKSKV